MKKTIIPTRYILVLGTFLLSLLLYVDRACISVAKNPIAESLNFSDTQMGWVLSAFALGYALFQTPSGILADRYGPRKVLSTIAALWSLFTALTAFSWNFLSMVVIRFLFGGSEAGAFPGISRAVFSWFPIQERGIITGINFSGSRLGAAFALPLVAWLVGAYGWRISFIILGAIGVIWSVIWYFLFLDDPKDHTFVSDNEKRYILENRQKLDPADEAEKLSGGLLLKSRNMWLAMFQYFGSNFTFFFTLTWLFPHLQNKYHLEIVEAGIYASLPLVAGAFGNWFSGWMVDTIYKSGQWQLSRRLPAISGFILVVVGLLGSMYMEVTNGAVFFLSMAIFGADMTLSPSWSFCVDIGKKHSGAVSGTMNMAGNFGSFFTALAFPYLAVWTGSNNLFFFIGALLALLSAICWLFMKPHKSLKEY